MRVLSCWHCPQVTPIVEKARDKAKEIAEKRKAAKAGGESKDKKSKGDDEDDEPPVDDDEDKPPAEEKKGKAAKKGGPGGPGGPGAKKSAPKADKEDKKEPKKAAKAKTDSGPPASRTEKAAASGKKEKPKAAGKAAGPAKKSGKGAAAAEDEGPAFKACDAKTKSKRIGVDNKRLKAQFREFDDGEANDMKEAFRPFVSEGLHALLFHKEFKQQVQGMDQITAAIASQPDEVVSVADLVLKYSAYRLCDSNTAILLSGLKLVSALFALLKEHDYQLQDGEANASLPFIVEKVLGHAKDQISGPSRDILRAATQLYPASKVLNIVLEALKSKNKRVAAMCCEEIGFLVARNGLVICSAPAKVVGDLGKVQIRLLNPVVQFGFAYGPAVGGLERRCRAKLRAQRPRGGLLSRLNCC